MKKRKKTLEEIMSQQYDLLCRSIAKYGKKDLQEDMSFIHPDNHNLNMMNPYSLKEFSNIFCNVCSKMIETDINGRVFSAILIDDEFDFGSKFGKFKVNKAKKKFKETLTGLDYIGNVTFAMYKNEKKTLDDGFLRSVHCHILFLNPISRKQRNKIKTMVKMDINKGIPLLVKQYSLQEAVEYIWHAPFPAYVSIPNKEKDNVAQIKVKPTLKALYDLYTKSKKYKIYDWTIAGGKGIEVWSNINSDLIAFLGSKGNE